MQKRTSEFDERLWPHLAAAYRFARWLVRNDHDAEDVVQDSFLKAFAGMETFRGRDPRLWLLAIVRNTAMNLLRGRRLSAISTSTEGVPEPADSAPDPEKRLIGDSRRVQVRGAIQQLPPEFRETLVLREFEELSYKEIAAVLSVPIGTVMSRLSRARALLLDELAEERRAAK